MTKARILVTDLTTDHELVLGHLSYKITNIETLSTGSRLITIDNGFQEVLQANWHVNVNAYTEDQRCVDCQSSNLSHEVCRTLYGETI